MVRDLPCQNLMISQIPSMQEEKQCGGGTNLQHDSAERIHVALRRRENVGWILFIFRHLKVE
jgi:hypothetical protein